MSNISQSETSPPILGVPSAEARMTKLLGAVRATARLHRRLADEATARGKPGVAVVFLALKADLESAIREVA